jgi:hypothetical protein
MNKPLSLALLIVSTLSGCLSVIAWAGETTSDIARTPVEQTPAPAGSEAPARQAPSIPGAAAQTRQQPPQWRMPRQYYGRFPSQYPAGGRYRAYPAAPAAAGTSPTGTELARAKEQLAEKTDELDKARTTIEQLRTSLQESQTSGTGLSNELTDCSRELDEAHTTIEQLRASLQENQTSGTRMSDKLTYCTREQHALRLRVIELTRELETANVAMEQQNRQLAAERDQLHSRLTNLDRRLVELQSHLRAANQALLQARAGTGMPGDAQGTARAQIETLREALGRLEAELERQDSVPEDDRETLSE